MGVVIKDPSLQFEYEIFSDGSLLNKTTGRIIKPSNDPRRPGEPPILYMQKKDGKRVFSYQDKMVAKYFLKDYEEGVTPVYHKDRDVTNCNVRNLYIGKAINVLRDVFHETCAWKHVELDDIKLYYEYYISEDGRLFNATTGSFVEPFLDKRPDKGRDYKRFNLYYGKSSREIIHVSAARLVAMNFLNKIDGKDLVLYRDGNRNNVSAENLYYGDNWDAVSKEVDAVEARTKTYLDIEPLGREKYKHLNKKFYKWYSIELADDYYVSNYGRVWNETKQFYLSKVREYISNPNNQYHQRVSLRVVGQLKNFMLFGVHILVALCFVDNPDGRLTPYVNHINGNPECNLSINLEWVSPLDNIIHAVMTNLHHSDMFEEMVTETNWRQNSILAWLDTFTRYSMEDRYKLFRFYHDKYPDNIMDLSYEEFLKDYEARKSSPDFIKLRDFYIHNYAM